MSDAAVVRRKADAGVALVRSTTGLLTIALASGGRVGPVESRFEFVWGETAQRYAFWYGLLATSGGLALGKFVGGAGEDSGGHDPGDGTQSR